MEKTAYRLHFPECTKIRYGQNYRSYHQGKLQLTENPSVGEGLDYNIDSFTLGIKVKQSIILKHYSLVLCVI